KPSAKESKTKTLGAAKASCSTAAGEKAQAPTTRRSLFLSNIFVRASRRGRYSASRNTDATSGAAVNERIASLEWWATLRAKRFTCPKTLATKLQYSEGTCPQRSVTRSHDHGSI